jgi:hypothetical protein
MVPLDFDDSAFHRSATAAFLFERFGQLLQLTVIRGNAGNHGHALALAALGRPPDPDDAVTGRFCRFFRQVHRSMFWLQAGQVRPCSVEYTSLEFLFSSRAISILSAWITKGLKRNFLP